MTITKDIPRRFRSRMEGLYPSCYDVELLMTRAAQQIALGFPYVMVNIGNTQFTITRDNKGTDPNQEIMIKIRTEKPVDGFHRRCKVEEHSYIMNYASLFKTLKGLERDLALI